MQVDTLHEIVLCIIATTMQCLATFTKIKIQLSLNEQNRKLNKFSDESGSLSYDTGKYMSPVLITMNLTSL